MADASVAQSETKPSDARPPQFDPEDFRMTVGEHLEELRYRILLGLGGLFVALVVCLIFGKQVMLIFCRPLIRELYAREINPQMYITEITQGFMVYMRVSLISAAALASPWIVYQLWKFVAAGLYPGERKAVTRYAPLSIVLLVSGMVFLYMVVLPWSIRFLLEFSSSVPLELDRTPSKVEGRGVSIPPLAGDPANPGEFEMWFNTEEGRLKFYQKGRISVVPFGPQNLLAPMITLTEYVDLVVGMLVVFGLAFQLPLGVMALGRLGIVSLSGLKRARKHVYFTLVIISAVVTPGDVLIATVALLVPLILLYEFGIVLVSWAPKKLGAEEQG